MLIKVLIVFVIEQTGSNFATCLCLFEDHPLTIIFILLVAGKAFGVVGGAGNPAMPIRVIATSFSSGIRIYRWIWSHSTDKGNQWVENEDYQVAIAQPDYFVAQSV